MNEILESLDYIPERIYSLWSIAIIVTIIASLFILVFYKDYKKKNMSKSFMKYIYDLDMPPTVLSPIMVIFIIITLVFDMVIIIGFLSGAIQLILF